MRSPNPAGPPDRAPALPLTAPSPTPPARGEEEAATRAPRDRPLRGWRLWAIILGMAVFANLFVASFVAQEERLYSWDTVNYWSKSVLLARTLEQDSLGGFARVLESLRAKDYNDLASLPLASGILVFGESRLAFELLVTNLYALPALVGLLFLLRRLIGGRGRRTTTMLAVAGVFLVLQPMVWAALLRGYVGVGGLLLASLVLILYFRRPVAEQPPATLAAMGVMLALLVLFRRWYAYWVVAFVLAAGVDTLVGVWTSGGRRLRAVVPALTRLTLLVGASGVVLVLLSWPMPWHMVTTDQGDIYHAYRPPGGLYESLFRSGFTTIPKMNGPLAALLAVISLGVGLWRPARRRVTLFIGGQTLLCLVIFSGTASLGCSLEHHLLVTFGLLVLCLLLLDEWRAAERRVARVLGAVGIVVVLLWSSAGLAWVFGRPPDAPGRLFCAGARLPGYAQHLAKSQLAGVERAEAAALAALPRPALQALPSLYAPPVERDDMDELERLLGVLQKLVIERSSSLYVLASGTVLNGHMLSWAWLSRGRTWPRFGERVARTHAVDARDGYPAPLVSQEYVLVCDPIETHLRPEDQRVVSVPAQHILGGFGIGAAYERLPLEFRLMGKVRAYIYRRTRPVTAAEIQRLSDDLRKFYPDEPFIYQPPEPAL